MFGFGGPSFDPEKDIEDLSGKVILVTGGNTGLGKESVLQLAKHKPAQIFLASRTPSKGEAAVADIKKAVPEANVTHLSLDLASLDSVKAAAKSFLAQSQRLDILINNAGIMAVPPGTTADGYEIQFGTNHIGHAALTKLLLPTLLSTASKSPESAVRIINLSSEGHRFAPTATGINLTDLTLPTSNGWARYGQAKLANILFTKSLAKHHPTLQSVAVHPGIVKTDLYLPSGDENFLIRWGARVFGGLAFVDVPTGAKNQLWAATSSKVESGGYYTPVGNKSQGSGYTRDEELAEKLWDWTEKELTKHGI
ncbi:MAG: hypothetical protein M4579_004663 [Chaenotheca gracillima]|nr:MAG: hypothetical protein M4579_004663 [Chaenotheca gracillima]